MATEVEPRTGRSNERRVLPYSALAGLAALTSVGIWLLMVGDEGRSVGGATVEMAAKFTNLTVLFVGATAVWIAVGRAGVVRSVAHLAAMVMAVTTAEASPSPRHHARPP